MRSGFRSICFLIVLGTSSALSASFASADTVEAMEGIWNRFQLVCGPALTDLDAFLATAQDRFTDAAFETLTSSDGNVFKFGISASNGAYFDSYSRWMMPVEPSESCATHYTGPLLTVGSKSAEAFETFVVAQVGEENLFGGQFEELYPAYQANPDRIEINPDNYQYRVLNGMEDKDLIIHVQVVSGFMSLWAGRDLP